MMWKRNLLLRIVRVGSFLILPIYRLLRRLRGLPIFRLGTRRRSVTPLGARLRERVTPHIDSLSWMGTRDGNRLASRKRRKKESFKTNPPRPRGRRLFSLALRWRNFLFKNMGAARRSTKPFLRQM